MNTTQKHAKTDQTSARTSTSVATRSAPNRLHFTEKRIAALAPPERGTRAYFYDDEVRGLTVAVSRGGKKTFLLYRFIGGRPERITIAPCGDLSVQKARARATEMNAAIVQGKNPAAARRALRDESTLADLFDMFLERYAKLEKRTWKEDVRMFNLHLHGLRFRKISTIRRTDVLALHAHIGSTSGKYIANRVIELLSSMFNKAIRDWEWEGTNPATLIKAFKERSRQRFVDASELPALFRALAEELNTTIRDYILVSLLCGGRRRNVQAMRWDEISFARGVWTIPPHKSKNDEELSIVLTHEVMTILESRKASSRSEWVFPGRGKSEHLEEPKACWKRILKRAGLTDLRLHDLRRTLGSWEAATGASLPIIGKSLGHGSLEATEVYARLNLDPVRESVNRATRAMLLAGGQPLTLEAK
jgi:integrase